MISELSGRACSVFHHALIRTNLFHSLSCPVSCVSHAFFIFFICFNLLIFVHWLNLEIIVATHPHEAMQGSD